MLQREVVDRIAARPDTEHYGRLSVMMQYHCDVEKLFDVPPGAFYPPPKVMSSIVRLTPYASLPAVANRYEHFSLLVREAFGQRRKTLRNSLKQHVGGEVWFRVAIAPERRAETLSVQEFVCLSNAIFPEAAK